MPNRNPKIDAYIANAEPFAQPILEHIRAAFHEGCPEIEENIKWGAPSFEIKCMVGGMAAFKKHATYGFWRSSELDDPENIITQQGVASFMAEKFTDVSQLPSQSVLADYVKRAADINISGKSKPKNPRLNKSKVELPIPAELAKLLAENPTANKVFEKFAPGQRRDYIEWITEARRDQTRQRRLDTTIAQLFEAKTRNWKYEKKK